MDECKDKVSGYVYILEVRDIDLPVCKIGMTSRKPIARCAEINRSSTGDFLWEVAFQFAVDDCKALESLAHRKLEPLRQRRREFFNISADVAHKALRSILSSQSDIKEISIQGEDDSPQSISEVHSIKKVRYPTFKKTDSEYAELLQSFTEVTNCKGRPFGQLNKPYFGMSDGNEGVQWNIAIDTEAREIRLGINLEGMKYTNWPIANFILNELENPSVEELNNRLEAQLPIIVRFTRDAWQVTSRPNILEKYIGGREVPISELNSQRWNSVLREALACLNDAKDYRGRATQEITLSNQPSKGSRTKSMQVSPHLTIWTPINLSDDIASSLKAGVKRLEPVHEWVSRVSQ
jgi:hypothetical protein